jgi:hypothetical protein
MVNLTQGITLFLRQVWPLWPRLLDLDLNRWRMRRPGSMSETLDDLAC